MRKYVWSAAALLSVAMVAAFFTASHAVQNPQSFLGRLAGVFFQVTGPRSTAPVQTMCCEPGLRPAHLNPAATDQPQPATQNPQRDLLDIIEPIIVEPPVNNARPLDVVRVGGIGGIEESELPTRTLTVPSLLASAPVRMPYADEEPVTAPADSCCCCPTVEGLLKSCCGVFWPGCRTWMKNLMPALTQPAAGTVEEAEPVETLPAPRSQYRFRDPHEMSCPHTGRCPAPPYHYRYLEIPAPAQPTVPATMPPAAEEEQGSVEPPEVLPEPRREN